MFDSFHALWRRMVGWFLAGLLAVMPLVLTAGIIIWVAGFLEGVVGPETVLGTGLQKLGLNFATNRSMAYFTGILLVFGTIFLLGIVLDLGARRYFEKLLDLILKHIPLVGNIYGTSRQVVDMFDRRDASEMQSMTAVYCSFGNDGGPGVLALMPSREIIRINDRDYHIVLVPTAPVPFGGGLLFMPKECVTPANMSVDGLMSIYISMGVTAPDFMSPKPKSENDRKTRS